MGNGKGFDFLTDYFDYHVLLAIPKLSSQTCQVF